jgi:putative aminopeptidase FrvX
VQYGVTGGGNDGAVFSRYGSVDIPLGSPLRYSHFPAEVIDTRDLDALARILGSYFSFRNTWFAIICPRTQPPPTAAW